ncbi:MAG TPA: hypothetical protein VFZ31_00375 [Vicinamibacterales bacterium]
MTDDELRGLIRAAIQKHMGAGGAGPEPAPPKLAVFQASEGGISFGQYRLERAAGDTSCLIEPAVQCNHCGFCKCHGH